MTKQEKRKKDTTERAKIKQRIIDFFQKYIFKSNLWIALITLTLVGVYYPIMPFFWFIVVENIGGGNLRLLFGTYVIIIIALVGLVIAAKYWFVQYLLTCCKKKNKIRKNSKKINNYVVVAVMLTLIVIPTGLFFIDIEFHSLPIKNVRWNFIGNSEEEQTVKARINSISEIECNSRERYYKTLVEGEQLQCEFKIKYTDKNEIFDATNIAATYSKGGTIIKEDSNVHTSTTGEIDGVTETHTFNVDIAKKDYVETELRLTFLDNQEGGIITYSNVYKATIVMKGVLLSEEYRDWTIQRLTWFLAIFTAGPILILTGVNIFRKLIQNK